MKAVPQRLIDLGKLYEQRNALYGDNYLHFGTVLRGMFPRGITLISAEDFNRFALFTQMVHKLTRYARAMPEHGHEDSLDDTAVYAQMLQFYDKEQK